MAPNLQTERYLGLVIGNDNFWKTQGLGCGQSLNSSGDDEGSGVLVGDGGYELLEVELPSSCAISYTIVETVHAVLYMLIAVS